MIVVNSINDLKEALSLVSKNIGFVPTMGALHDGHISLLKKAREENEIVVSSIFVNPTQFLVGEDLDKYPKKMEADRKICELCKVDILFTPNITDMYEDDEVLIKAPNIKGFVLEGLRRPGHFDGVLQIVLKLFNLIKPTNAYFGKKDAQQLAMINQMTKNLFLDVNIIPCEIIRESDGLAMSSRNVYLSNEDRQKALSISKSLKIAAKMIGNKELNKQKIIDAMKDIMNEIDIEYIEIVNRDFEFISEVEIKNSMILVAAKVGTTRLIDNIWV